MSNVTDLYPTSRKLISPIEPFVTVKTIVAAGDYADNDTVSESATIGTSWSFTGAVRASGGAGKLVGGSISSSQQALLATHRLHLFAAVPTASELNDNVAFAGVGAADEPNYLGFIDFPALVDVGAFSFVKAVAPTPAAPLLLHSTSANGTIYGLLVITDAETNESAGMTVTITLYID